VDFADAADRVAADFADAADQFEGGTAMVGVMIAAAGLSLVSAQESGQGRDTARAIQELTAEIRGLRAAVTRSAETQLQGQVLGLYLTLQQARVLQATARLDTIRREIEGTGNQARVFADEVVALDARVSEESDPERRRVLEAQMRASKQQSERFAAQEQALRNREGEIIQAAQTEEARWNELIARLEQLLKK
jgi:hypothetical protein